MSNVTQLEEAIKNVFDAADQLARETGFVQRVQPGRVHWQELCGNAGLGEACNQER